MRPPLEYPGIANLVGVPWVNGGRDRRGVDCYGLIKLALMEIGEEMPDSPKDMVTLMGLGRARAVIQTPPSSINPWDIVILCSEGMKLPPNILEDGEEMARLLALSRAVTHGALVADGSNNILEARHDTGGVVVSRLNRDLVRSVVRLKRFL